MGWALRKKKIKFKKVLIYWEIQTRVMLLQKKKI
jgi:hypothetical protein